MTSWTAGANESSSSSSLFNSTDSSAPAAAFCVVPSEYFALIGDLTAQPLVQAVFKTVYGILLTLSVTANSCIILVIVSTPSEHTARNVFIVNLASSDLIVSLVSGVLTPWHIFHKSWIFGRFLCRTVSLIQGLGIGISTYTLAAIACDRYILIVRPGWKPINTKRAIVVCCIMWTLAAAMVTPPVVYRRLKRVAKFCGLFCTEFWPDTRVHRAYGLLCLVVQFALPLCVIVFCYSRLINTVNKSLRFRLASAPQQKSHGHKGSDGKSQPSQNGAAGNCVCTPTTDEAPANNAAMARYASQLRQSRSMTRLLVGIVATFAFFWTPHVVFTVSRDVHLWPTFIIHQHFFFSLLVHLLAMCTTVTNPLLYGLGNTHIRQALRNRLLRCNVQPQKRYITTAAAATGGHVSVRLSPPARSCPPPATAPCVNRPLLISDDNCSMFNPMLGDTML